MVFYYDHWPVSRGWMQPVTTAIAAAALALLALASFVIRKWWPLAATGILFFLAGHLITSSYLPLEPVFEHRNYLPALGLLVAAASLLNRDWGARKTMVMCLIGLWLAASAGQSLLRASHWGASPLRFAEHHAEHALGSSRACYDLALMYVVASNFEPQSPAFPAASHELQRCAELPGASLLPAQAGILLHARGATGEEREWWDRLDAGLRDPMTPSSSVALITLAQCRLQNRCPVDDIRLQRAAEKALSLASTTSEVDRAMGDLHWRVFNDPILAERAYQSALERDGGRNYAASFALAALLTEQCRVSEAEAALTALAKNRESFDDRDSVMLISELLSQCN